MISVAAFAQPPGSYSSEKESALGKALAADFERRSKLLDDPVTGDYVQKLANKLAASSGAKLALDVKVVQSAEPGAGAFPGAFLFVNSGLIAGARTEAELAGILAHEIVHIAARHGLRPTASREVIVMDGWSGMCARFGDSLVPVGLQAEQRGFEQEADLLGVEYAANAGYDPHGLADFWERLQPSRTDLAAVRARVEELTATPRNFVLTSPEFLRVQERHQTVRPVPPSLRNK